MMSENQNEQQLNGIFDDDDLKFDDRNASSKSHYWSCKSEMFGHQNNQNSINDRMKYIDDDSLVFEDAQVDIDDKDSYEQNVQLSGDHKLSSENKLSDEIRLPFSDIRMSIGDFKLDFYEVLQINK